MPCVPREAGDVVGVVDVVGAADVLDDVEALADRDDLRGVLHRVGEGLQVAVEPDGEALGRADRLLLEDLGAELGELGLGSARRSPRPARPRRRRSAAAARAPFDSW